MLHNRTIYFGLKAWLMIVLGMALVACQSLPTSNVEEDDKKEEERQESQSEQQAPAKSPVTANKPPVQLPATEEERPAKVKQVLAPPKLPQYQWRDYPRINAVMIADKQWQAVQRYHKEFMLYASQVQAMILAGEPDTRLPRVPTLMLPTTQNVPSQDVPATDRNQRYLSLALRDSQAVDAFMRESSLYIERTQELL